jgi:thioredoxin-related protein
MEWLTDFKLAKEESLKSKKLILLQFEMENCGGCNKLAATTFQDRKVVDDLNEWFVLLKIDIIKDREVRRNLGAYWTPALYFLDQNGNSFYHFNGYLPADEFRAMLRLGIAETIMPLGRYDDIIKIIEKDIDELKNTSLYPKLLVTSETASYIKIKDNSRLRKTLKEIQSSHPQSTEAEMYFWDE